MPPEEKANLLPSGLVETPNQTAARAQQLIQPTVSAADLVNTPTQIAPPTPRVNTNDGSRTANLVNNVAAGTQQFIASQSEEAAKARELAGLLGTQTFDASGQRTQLNEQFGLPTNLARLTDIQTQLAQANTASQAQKVNIGAAAGQTLNQLSREVTTEDRLNAVRTAGLAAEAAVLQGSIETASTLVNNAMQDFYQDRQLRNENMINQLNYFQGIADEQTGQLLGQEARKYAEDQANITRAQSLVDSAVSSGYLSGADLTSVLENTDPVVQAEQVQQIIARGIQKDIADAKAAAASAGFDVPETKNFGTNDAPIWKQWNASLGVWEDVPGNVGPTAEDPQQALDQLSFLRDNAARILGGTDQLTGEPYDPLYKSSGLDIGARAAGFIFGDTGYSRLESYADTLKTNVLALMTDPTVRKFFGPQMSNADVRLMSSAGTSLRPDSQSPSDLKAEVERLDDLFNRMETAVRQGTTQPNQTVMPTSNIITAPDGTRIEIID